MGCKIPNFFKKSGICPLATSQNLCAEVLVENVSNLMFVGRCNRIVGRCNRIVRRCNCIVRRCNRIVGRCNRIVGRCNCIVGRCNRIVGRCNCIVGRCNRIVGRCNCIVGRCNYKSARFFLLYDCVNSMSPKITATPNGETIPQQFASAPVAIE
ncbi:hypothetical protein NIES4106_24980 [Fischerella sp. NIES-4106]|nr:hypothetical protein NIES4106_24980 [Fischerella sp. NIES-4106]